MQNLRRISLLAVLFLSQSNFVLSGTGDCQTLDACMAELRTLAAQPRRNRSGLTQDEVEFGKRVAALEGAVPELIGLLADPDINIANEAAAALRNATYIDPKYLPNIEEGLDRGLGWLPVALSRIPTDAAAKEAVARFLTSKSAPENQEAFAVLNFGKRAVPFIVEAARCPHGCNLSRSWMLAALLKRMGPERSSAAPGLIAIAQDSNQPHSAVLGALIMISSLGEDGKSVESQLIALRETSPGISGAVDDALIGIHSSKSGEIFSRRLQMHADRSSLFEVARAGAAAHSAGPELVHLLNDPDWEVRIAAASSMSSIEYWEGSNALIAATNQSADVRLTWAAVESLGRLRVTSATDALQHVADGYWYPPVREAASLAIRNIETGTAYPVEHSGTNHGRPFFDSFHIESSLDTCRSPLVVRKQEPSDQKLYGDRSGSLLRRFAYPGDLDSNIQVPPEPNRDGQASKDRTDDVAQAEHSQNKRIPNVALRVDHGWLVGSNRGEWGGELVYIDDNGSMQQILDMNVEDIYFLGNDIVTTTGLAHLGINIGTISKVSRQASGRWAATPWRGLPGAPESSILVDTGELLINVANGGTILVSPEGAMRMAPCADPK